MKFRSILLAKAMLLCALSVVSCSKDEDKDEVEMEQQESETGITIHEDVKFAVDKDGVDSKRFFSTSTGKMYSFNEIDAEIGATVDLVWYDSSPSNSGFLFWEDPSDLFGNLDMPGATATKIENYEPKMSAEQYDLIERKEQLNVLTVEHSNDAMGPVEYPIAILFENASGKKGIIKMKSNDGDFMTADIKVVK